MTDKVEITIKLSVGGSTIRIDVSDEELLNIDSLMRIISRNEVYESKFVVDSVQDVKVESIIPSIDYRRVREGQYKPESFVLARSETPTF